MSMTREKKLQKAHRMFDGRNLLTELKWQREYFKSGYVNSQEELFNLWIFDECIKVLEQEPTPQERQAESDKFDAAFQDGYNNGYAQARFDYEQEPTTVNDLALIRTEGLDEEIRCTMCTNHMKSDRGCDGSCVVNEKMYKAVMDAIEKRIQSTTKNNLPHCQHTDEEIAKSFVEDVEAVKEQLPCGEQMDFPSTFDEFAKDYGFKDKDEIYTNGSELIPVFRVKQWLEHITTTKNDLGVENDLVSSIVEKISEKATETREEFIFETIRPYCENVVQMKISKRDLEQALLKYYGKNDLAVDCISREAVERIINKWLSHSDYELKDHIYSMTEKIHNLPSVTPQEPRKGHWILTDVEGNRVWHCNCSECGKDPQDYIGGSENWWLIKSKLPKYCPNCSADMRGREE